MDVFNNSISERGNKTTNQIQESHRILKSNLMINNQTLDTHKNVIISLQEKIHELETVYTEIETCRNDINSLQVQVNNIKDNIERTNILSKKN